MNFLSVKNVQKYYNCINPSLSTVKKFYAMLHLKYYGSTTLSTKLVLQAGLHYWKRKWKILSLSSSSLQVNRVIVKSLSCI